MAEGGEKGEPSNPSKGRSRSRAESNETVISRSTAVSFDDADPVASANAADARSSSKEGRRSRRSARNESRVAVSDRDGLGDESPTKRSKRASLKASGEGGDTPTRRSSAGRQAPGDDGAPPPPKNEHHHKTHSILDDLEEKAIMLAEVCHHLEEKVTELHKQRYKAVLTNSSLSIANDKLKEAIAAEKEKSAALEAKLAEDAKSLEAKLVDEFGKTGFSVEASAKIGELGSQIGVLEAEVASLKDTEVSEGGSGFVRGSLK